MALDNDKQKRRTGDQKLMQELNRHIVLDTIRRRGPIARSEIAKFNGISPTTVTSAVSELIAEGIVTEIGTGLSSGGRKPVMLRFEPNGRFLIGVSIANSMLTIAEFNLEAAIRSRHDVPMGDAYGEAAVDFMLREIGRFLKQYDDLSACMGISVTMPGIIHAGNGVVVFNYRLNLSNVHLKQAIEQKFGLNVWLDNDVNAIALAEHRFGKFADCRNLICIKMNNGVGGGIIANGMLLRGLNGGAGEFGSQRSDLSRIVKEREGLSRELSWPSLYAHIIFEISLGKSTAMMTLANGDIRLISPQIWLDALQEADPLALEIMDRFATYWGNFITNLVGIFNPEAIVLGGSLIQENELLLGKIREIVYEQCWESVTEGMHIELSSFGSDFELIGAAAVALQDVFQCPI
jgi:predicted NBD/HSP70 family sugar kinase